jgi:predicted lipoprotein with Yx(FWY)xxD motif
MRKITLLLAAALVATGLLAFTGCGGDDDSDSGASAAQKEEAAMKKEEAAKEAAAMKKEEAAMKKKEAAAMKKEEAAKKEAAAMKKEEAAGGTTVTVGSSEFGTMLFDSNQQAIYIFQNDSQNKSNCYGECAAAWPPVLTKGEPKAANGADSSLLGTIERRDGSTQVTYAGQPLYFYANEGPSEVECHNVNLNGGFWWVVGPDGERRA